MWSEVNKKDPTHSQEVKLCAVMPPIKKMDSAQLSMLKSCEKLSLSTNSIERIAPLKLKKRNRPAMLILHYNTTRPSWLRVSIAKCMKTGEKPRCPSPKRLVNRWFWFLKEKATRCFSSWIVFRSRRSKREHVY